MPPRGAILLMMMVSRIRLAKWGWCQWPCLWDGDLGFLVAVAAFADRFRSAAVAMCCRDRLHVNSCGYLGHPPSGSGVAPWVLSATRRSAGQK